MSSEQFYKSLIIFWQKYKLQLFLAVILNQLRKHDPKSTCKKCLHREISVTDCNH